MRASSIPHPSAIRTSMLTRSFPIPSFHPVRCARINQITETTFSALGSYDLQFSKAAVHGLKPQQIRTSSLKTTHLSWNQQHPCSRLVISNQLSLNQSAKRSPGTHPG